MKALCGIAAIVLSVSLAGKPHAQAAGAKPEVTLQEGRASGIRSGNVDAFLGLPYAAPPVGGNRWRSPQPAPTWRGIRTSDRFGPSCPQAIAPGGFGPWTQEYVPSGPTDEDCLSLNVWRPVGARKLPVFVWIHGGGFTSGSSSVPIYDGEAFARQGIVVVSLNYRLGFLGTLGSPEFRNTGGGNFGLQDQIAALRWIQRNIAALGGDPRRITIAGQSAGAISVHGLILSPDARGLFQQAIPQSGLGLGTGLGLAFGSRDAAERNAATFITGTGAGSVSQARDLPLAQLSAAYMEAKAAVPGFSLGPYADGLLLPDDPARAFSEGRYNDTPVLVGLTSDEGSGLNPNYRERDPAKLEALFGKRFGALAPEFGRLYPPDRRGERLPSVLRDAGIASLLEWGRTRGRISRFPMYGYVWTHVEPGPNSERYGAFHTSEVPYVLGTLDKAVQRPFSPQDRRISELMQRHWANFVKTGNPNGRALPQWPSFGARGQLVELGARVQQYPMLPPEIEQVFDRHLKAGGSLLVF